MKKPKEEEIAEELGITRMSLHRYRRGLREWPFGMQERCEQIERRQYFGGVNAKEEKAS